MFSPAPIATLTTILLAATLLLPASAQACDLPPRAAAIKAETIALTNLQRKKKGLRPLAENAALAKAAQAHACDNAATRIMSHTGSDGSTLPDRLKRVGYRYSEAYENVAAGFRDAPSVMSGWMNSSGHRRNILASGAQDIGIGMALGSDGQLYWTMDLGKSR